MKKRQAKKIVRSKIPHTETQLRRAIEKLGKTPGEIVKNVILLGFADADQGDGNDCQVCRYLRSLGLNLVSVSTQCARVMVPGGMTTFIEFPPAMQEFQMRAQIRSILGLGGYQS